MLTRYQPGNNKYGWPGRECVVHGVFWWDFPDNRVQSPIKSPSQTTGTNLVSRSEFYLSDRLPRLPMLVFLWCSLYYRVWSSETSDRISMHSVFIQLGSGLNWVMKKQDISHNKIINVCHLDAYGTQTTWKAAKIIEVPKAYIPYHTKNRFLFC